MSTVTLTQDRSKIVEKIVRLRRVDLEEMKFALTQLHQTITKLLQNEMLHSDLLKHTAELFKDIGFGQAYFLIDLNTAKHVEDQLRDENVPFYLKDSYNISTELEKLGPMLSAIRTAGLAHHQPVIALFATANGLMPLLIFAPNEVCTADDPQATLRAYFGNQPFAEMSEPQLRTVFATFCI